MTRRFAIADQATLGAQLLLQQGGQVVTFDTDGANLNRNARSTQGVDSGKWYWEVIVGGTLDMASNVSIGVQDEAVADNTQVGDVTDSYGYQAGDGLMLAAGSTDATVAVAQKKDVIGFALDVDPATPTLGVYLNRLLLHTFSLPTGKTWFPAISIGGATALQLSALFNMGKRQFENTPPDDYRPGIYTDVAGISLRLAGPHDFLSSGTDSPPLTRYAGRILNPDRFFKRTASTVWPFGQRGYSVAYGDLDLDNSDGMFDALLADPPRGKPVEIALLKVGDDLADPEWSTNAILEDVSEPSLKVCRVRLGGVLSRFKVPLPRQVYTPFVADGAANRVKPIALGACRNVPGVLVDEATRRYDVHDATLTEIAAVRDKGDRLDPLATPPDYTSTADLRGINLQTDPVGKLTLDVSSQGDSSLTPPPSTDALEGYGDMATDTGGMPTRWVRREPNMDDQTVLSRVSTDGGRLQAETSVAPIGNNIIFEAGYEDQSTSLNFIPIRKNVRYKLTFTIPESHWPPVTRTAPLRNAAIQNNKPTALGADLTAQAIWSTSGTWAAGSYTAYFKATDDGTIGIYGYGIYDAGESGQPGWYALPWHVQFDDVVVEAITTVPLNVLNDGSADVSYGQMTGVMPFWLDDGTTAGSSYSQSDLVTGSYTMGRMLLAVGAGVGEKVRTFFDVGTSTGSLRAGKNYRAAFLVAGASSNAVLRIISRDEATFSVDTVIAEVTGNGDHELTFTAADNGYFLLEAYTADDLAGDFYVSYLRVLDTTDQDAEETVTDDLTGITLADYFDEILVKRFGAATSDYEPADLTDLDAVTGYTFGVVSQEQINTDDMLQAPLDSYCAALTEDDAGKIRVGRLVAPEDFTDYDVAFHFAQRGGVGYAGNMEGPPEPLDAKAQGLTTNAGYRHNWSPYQPGDFVDDFDPDTGIDAATRERFKRTSQYLVRSTKDLHPQYRDAQDAGQIDFLLDKEDDAQTEIDRVNDIFTILRRPFRLRGKYDGTAPSLRFGSCVKCTYDRYGFNSGKLLTVLEVSIYPFAKTVEVIALC